MNDAKHNNQAGSSSYWDGMDEQSVDQRIDELISRMTLEEKLGQMNYFDASAKAPEEAVRAGRAGRAGLLANVKEAAHANELQRIAVEESRLGIPLFIGNDVIHGFRTIFPIPLAEACSWDPELMEQTAAVAAREAIASGTQLIYGPMVDITREPRWGRIAESPGEDPFLASVYAEAKVKGFQRNDWTDMPRISACAKHFIVYGGAEGGKDYNTVQVSPQNLHEIYLPPFIAAIRAGVKNIMTAFHDLNGIPMAANRPLVADLLKKELGYEGFVVTDYNAIAELITHGVAANREEACIQSLLGGTDMDMNADIFLEVLPDLVRSGKVPETMIDDAVRRILKVKFWAGLFERPYVPQEKEASVQLCSAHMDAALDAAHRSMVLLKNEGDLLPLNKNLGSIAVIGPLAGTQDLLGCWPCSGKEEEVITVLDSIRRSVGNETVIRYAKGCDLEGDARDGFAEAVAAAEASDVVIVAVGESSAMSGEAHCRASLYLPGVQNELVEAICETGKPVVVVLINGRPLAIEWIAEHVPAILEAWFPGNQAGPAIADLLFGDFNPSGKLTVAFPRSTGQIPVYYNHKNTGRPEDSRPIYASCYLDLPSEPLFPFGFGLSYTRFKYDNLILRRKSLRMTEELQISVEIENTGVLAGEEIIQVYTRDLVASMTRPVKELKAFRKIHLKPGERKEVQFEIAGQSLGFYNAGMEYVVEPGGFKIWVGPNSVEGLEESFEIIG